VARRLRALRPDLPALVIGPRRLRPWAETESLPFAHPQSDAPDRDELQTWVESIASATPGHLWLVDVFPRGVLGDLSGLLPSLDRAPWLVSRRVRAEYYLDSDVRAALEGCYERLLWCEEPEPGLEQLRLPQERIPPICCRRPDECLSRGDARSELGVDAGEPLVILLGSGPPRGQGEMLRLLLHVRSRLGATFRLEMLSAELPSREEPGVRVRALYPAMCCLRAADLVVSAAGYSAVWEARRLGVRSVWIPQPRQYDDQLWRGRSGVVAGTPPELEASIASALSAPAEEPAPLDLEDGAATLAARLSAATPAPPTTA
jgi:Glycosyltransferase family 28 C-terminal domain